MTAAPALAASTSGIAEHTQFTWDTTKLELFRRFLENPGAVKKLAFRQESLLFAADSGSSPPLYSGSFQGMEYVLNVEAGNAGTNLVTEMTVGFAKQEHWYRAGDVVSCFSEKYNKSQTNRVLQIARASEQTIRTAIALGIFQMKIGTARWDASGTNFTATTTDGRAIVGYLVLDRDRKPLQIDYKIETYPNVAYMVLFGFSERPPLGFLPYSVLSQYVVAGTTQKWQQTELLSVELQPVPIPEEAFSYSNLVVAGRTALTFYSNDVYYVQASDRGTSYVVRLEDAPLRRLPNLLTVLLLIVLLAPVPFSLVRKRQKQQIAQLERKT